MTLVSAPPFPSTFIPKPHRDNHHNSLSLHRNNHHHHHNHNHLFCRPIFTSRPISSRTFFSSSPPPSQLDDDDEEPEPITDTEKPETKPEPEPEAVYENRFSEAEAVAVEGGGGKDVNMELKRCLVDTVYGSSFGFRASAEERAEAAEFINQLEAANPVPNPNDAPALLNGNWVLVYTASSELLPLLAVGTTPLLKVERISQNIDTGSSIIENSTTLSTPFATFSFSATASFDVRSPSRIQVQFKEASFKPPEIKSQFDLPVNVDILGQQITLSPVQQLLNPVQEAAASISSTLNGLPPLKVPIPGERTSSWLITTYLDDDVRISRGDGGLFVLVREGSPLLSL